MPAPPHPTPPLSTPPQHQSAPGSFQVTAVYRPGLQWTRLQLPSIITTCINDSTRFSARCLGLDCLRCHQSYPSLRPPTTSRSHVCLALPIIPPTHAPRRQLHPIIIIIIIIIITTTTTTTTLPR
ncbi:hypothetical protein CDD80_4237 [Ophiocordyceps camponoti-rufipedis]|uniref:Uncharacterized protein n=1 Tax=Ophiocordyceps camponoti-rufipedis TaxID=2004952 RepID=A0A2C5ZIR0_9HYPO|nr:hypothetical protein CDD80_4237 [Ophiocordyceps camponoti-rufipedis]